MVEVKLAEQKARQDRVDKAALKQKYLGIIAEKQHLEDQGKSIEELTKLVDELE